VSVKKPHTFYRNVLIKTNIQVHITVRWKPREDNDFFHQEEMYKIV